MRFSKAKNNSKIHEDILMKHLENSELNFSQCVIYHYIIMMNMKKLRAWL